MRTRSKSLFVIFWVLLSLIVVTAGSEYASQQLGLIFIYGLLALSFTYVWGIGGIFSLCQSALFGIGAYAYGTITINLAAVPGAGFMGLFVAALVPAAVAAVFGWFIFFGRLSGMYVAVATLALDLALLTFMNGTASPSYAIGQAALGGQNGMVGILPLSFGAPEIDSGFTNRDFLIFVAIVNLFVTLGAWWSLKTRWFTTVFAVRDNELRARTLGFDSRLYRLGLFVLGAGVAGLAGGEYAAQQMFVSTNVFTLPMAALVIVWVLLGGRKSVAGAYIGVGIMQLLVLLLAGTGSDIEVFVSGLIMIAAVTLLPDGIVSLIPRLAQAWRTRESLAIAATSGVDSSVIASAGPIVDQLGRLLNTDDRPVSGSGGLEVRKLYKSFGGVVALKDLSLQFAAQSTTCIVGPNGAGKSTFFHLVSGKFEADHGTLVMMGKDITKCRLEDRIGLGIAVKYQTPELFQDLTVHQHLKLAICASRQDLSWRQADRIAQDWEGFFSLEAMKEEIAMDLAHGEAQKLDIAMAICCRPSVLLLDEPTAGLNPDEIRHLEQVIKALRERMTVVVITHDFSFVARLASRVVVMSEGGLFVSGSVDELKANEEFIELYLGRRGSTFKH